MKNKVISVLLAAMTILCAVSLASCGESAMDYTKTDLSQYVTLGEYKGLTVEMPVVPEITDLDVDNEIETALSEHAELQIVDRAAANGDTVNIDYAGTQNGVAFEGGTAQAKDLQLGSNEFISGFESGLVGHSAGETVVLDLTFPEEYPNNPDLAGTPVEFTVTINSVSGMKCSVLGVRLLPC